MTYVPEHICPRLDPEDRLSCHMVTCEGCFLSWCELCDPATSALCHVCHGRGYSLAPIPPRQRRAFGVHYPAFRRPAWQRVRT